jgi:hypothetical protein
MGLEKAIEHGKEHRKSYRGVKTFDRTCRNHGSCAWCRENRLHQIRREREKMKNKMEEYYGI